MVNDDWLHTHSIFVCEEFRVSIAHNFRVFLGVRERESA
jgi:hypothetical protein